MRALGDDAGRLALRPGASEAQLVAAEGVLGWRLPDAYRAWLQIANGQDDGALSILPRSGRPPREERAMIREVPGYAAPGDTCHVGTCAQPCPGFVALDGAGSHRYKVISTSDSWLRQQMACKELTPHAYLVVPDNEAELAATDAFAGASMYWVGVNDIAAKGAYMTALDTPQTFVPWESVAPHDAGSDADCVEAVTASHKFHEDRCTTLLPTVCECDP